MMEKALSYVSLAKRAGQLASGAFTAEKAVKDKSARLVLVAVDASENTRKHFRDMCAYRGIPMRVTGSKRLLGKSVGEEERTVLAVLSEGLAAAVLKTLPEETEIEHKE